MRLTAVAVMVATATTIAVGVVRDGRGAVTSPRRGEARPRPMLAAGGVGSLAPRPSATPASPAESRSAIGPWERRADAAQAALAREYANVRPADGWPGLYRLRAPAGLRDRIGLRYWWQAHAIDALVDRQERAPTPRNLARIRAVVRGVRATNHGRITNDYYDDMGWMALALLRADAVGAGTAPTARRLWHVIRSGWNEAQGGGVPWRRQQPAYKNVPANGPAAILAARLYRRDGRREDLAWAERIVAWMHATLVDAETGVVWDGVNRRGDGRIDRRWLFTYTHGVALGADVELHAITGDPALLTRARRTAAAALDRLAPDGILRDEGPGDGALFKGILARYLAALDDPRARDVLRASGEAAWAARDRAGRFGTSWREAPRSGAELSAHLSGTMLLERLAALERA